MYYGVNWILLTKRVIQAFHHLLSLSHTHIYKTKVFYFCMHLFCYSLMHIWFVVFTSYITQKTLCVCEHTHKPSKIETLYGFKQLWWKYTTSMRGAVSKLLPSTGTCWVRKLKPGKEFHPSPCTTMWRYAFYHICVQAALHLLSISQHLG